MWGAAGLGKRRLLVVVVRLASGIGYRRLLGPFTANTAKDATTILQFPAAGYANYAALQAAVIDESVAQVVIRISETDTGGFDDDGANVSLYLTCLDSFMVGRATTEPFQLGT